MQLGNTPSPSIFIQCYRIPEGFVREMFTLTVSLVSCPISPDPSAGLSLRVMLTEPTAIMSRYVK